MCGANRASLRGRAASCDLRAARARRLGAGQVRVQLNSRALLEDTLRAGVLRARRRLRTALRGRRQARQDRRRCGGHQLCDPAGAVQLSPAEARDVVRCSAHAASTTRQPPRRRLASDRRAAPPLRTARRLRNRQYVDFDASVVRVSPTTPASSSRPTTRAQAARVCGGGRYDRLLEALAAVDPGGRLRLRRRRDRRAARDHGLLPRCRADSTTSCVRSASAAPRAIRVAERLRAESRRRAVLGESRPKRVLADADKAGARSVWLLGPTKQRAAS